MQSAFELPVSIVDLLALMDAHTQGRYPDDPAWSYSADETAALIGVAAAVIAAAIAALAGE